MRNDIPKFCLPRAATAWVQSPEIETTHSSAVAFDYLTRRKGSLGSLIAIKSEVGPRADSYALRMKTMWCIQEPKNTRLINAPFDCVAVPRL